MFGKNALVVDDSMTARSVLKHQLNQFDVVVESAPDGNHALKMLRSHTPDVIFLDHVMPGLDGFQVLERLKADSVTRRIPVVMYTSQAAPQYIREAKVLGAVAVIPKNVTDEQLVDALNKAEVYQLGAANDDRHSPEQGREFEPATDKARLVRLDSVESERYSAPAELDLAPTARTDEFFPELRGEAANAPRRTLNRTENSQPQLSAIGRCLVPLLLATLVCSNAHMLWLYREQQQIIAELRRVTVVDEHRFSRIYKQLEAQQVRLNETNSRQVELVMNLLFDRAPVQGSRDPAEDLALE